MSKSTAIAALLIAGIVANHKVLDWNYFQTHNEPVPLINIKSVIPDAILDIKYATSDNITGKPVYEAPLCLIRPELANALKRADDELKTHGFRLLFWDCYRPYSLQRVFYDAAVKKGLAHLFANPRRGSNHNRGMAVDVGLVAMDGTKVDLPTKFDDLSKQARSNAKLKNKQAQRNRELLKKIMKKNGFTTIRSEWWHFNYKNALRYPLIDVPFTHLEHLK